QALNKVMVNKPTIVVADHHMKIRNTYVIAMVKNGILVENGKQDDMMKRPNGAYVSFVAYT
ncbi:hypothetical protein Ancab_034136, partial [Ancistrocladus abbreviatus]